MTRVPLPLGCFAPIRHTELRPARSCRTRSASARGDQVTAHHGAATLGPRPGLKSFRFGPSVHSREEPLIRSCQSQSAAHPLHADPRVKNSSGRSTQRGPQLGNCEWLSKNLETAKPANTLHGFWGAALRE
jgi:hypothetical protein